MEKITPEEQWRVDHTREHDGLLREVAGAAAALDSRVRETAAALAKQVTDTSSTLETRVREIADLHWANHRIEHESDQRAIDKVERNMVDKFASVNEFREQQKDIISGFMPRKEYDTAHGSLVDRVDQLRLDAGNHITRDEYSSRTKSMDDRVSALEIYRSSSTGAKEQSRETQERSEWSTGLIIAIALSLLSSVVSTAALIAHLVTK